MKKLNPIQKALLMTGILLGVLNTQAQTHFATAKERQMDMFRKRQQAWSYIQQPTQKANKTESLQQRLRAFGIYIVDSGAVHHHLVDSARFQYSQGRGSIPVKASEWGQVQYFTASYVGNQFSKVIEVTNPKTVYDYNMLQADTITEWLDTSATHNYPMVVFEKHAYQYDANNRPTNSLSNYGLGGRFNYSIDPQFSMDYGTSKTIYDKNLFTYDGAGRLTSRVHLEKDSAGVYDTLILHNIVYDATGKITSDNSSIKNFPAGSGWRPLEKNLFTYDAASNIIAWNTYFDYYNDGTLWHWDSTTYSYDASNRIETLNYSNCTYIGGHSMVALNADSFGYTGSNPNWTFELESHYDTLGVVTSQIKYIGSLNAAGLIDTVREIQRDSIQKPFTLKGLDVNQYNSNQQLTRMIWYQLGNSGQLDGSAIDYYFYYEDYNPTGISETPAAPAVSFNLFPNPSAGKFMVETAEKSGVITLTNLAGQLLLEQSIEGNQTSVSTPPLSAGIYLVNLKAAGKSSTKKIIIE